MKSIAYPVRGRCVGELRHGDHSVLEDGEYGRWSSTWYARTPNGLICNLERHMVVEHKDGTITARPSIDVRAGVGEHWHGFLTKGVWTLEVPR